MLLVNKIAVIAATVLFLLGIFAFAGTFDPGYAGIFGPDADAATNALFWPSFVGAALIVMSNPVSFGAFLGDWARYIPRETPAWKSMSAAFLAQVATLVPFLFGLVTATVVATNASSFMDEGNYVGGLLAVSPGWYFVPVCLIALIGGMSTGTTALYGTGLDFSSVFPRFSRVQATVFIGVIAIAFIFVGRFAFNVVQSISTFAVLIVTCTAPWMVVMMIGWFVRRGWYDSDALQVFNRRQRGGRYWFTHGWNWRGLGAWLVAAALSICFVNIPGQFVGPFGNLANGIDLSIPVGLGLAAVLYPVLLWAFPEPADAFGPDGPRGVPSRTGRQHAHHVDGPRARNRNYRRGSARMSVPAPSARSTHRRRRGSQARPRSPGCRDSTRCPRPTSSSPACRSTPGCPTGPAPGSDPRTCGRRPGCCGPTTRPWTSRRSRSPRSPTRVTSR